MMVKVIPRYVDHLWYPILVKVDGGHNIVEMQGRNVNEWNDMVRRKWYLDTNNHPKGWCV